MRYVKPGEEESYMESSHHSQNSEGSAKSNLSLEVNGQMSKPVRNFRSVKKILKGNTFMGPNEFKGYADDEESRRLVQRFDESDDMKEKPSKDHDNPKQSKHE